MSAFTDMMPYARSLMSALATGEGIPEARTALATIASGDAGLIDELLFEAGNDDEGEWIEVMDCFKR